MNTFSVYPTEGRFQIIASLDYSIDTVGYIHFSSHNKVHHDVYEHLVLIANYHLLLAPYKLTSESHP